MDIERPIISVLMPAYNSERYIADAIQSILNQTYKNFELIIMNDGSSDGTAEIIDSFSDPRIVKVHMQQNRGLVATRNALIQLARGCYIAYLDSDDIAFPDRLSVQLEFLEADNADLCSGAYQTVNELTGERRNSKESYTDSDIKALITVYCPLCNPAVMGRTEIFRKFPYREGNDYAEDYSLWQEVALAGYRLANLTNQLIIYRIHPKQVSQLQNARAAAIFDRCRSDYIGGLGIDPDSRPQRMPFKKRIVLAPKFLFALNKKITNISFQANYQIYSRFQYRGNGAWTPLTRIERILFCALATLTGRF